MPLPDRVQGIRTMRALLDDPSRSYRIDVRHAFPARTVRYNVEGLIATDADKRELLRCLPRERHFGEAFAVSMENATVVGSTGMVLTPDGVLVKESTSMATYRVPHRPDWQQLTDAKTRLGKPVRLPGHALVLANPNGGYAHQLLESFFLLPWFGAMQLDCILVAKGPNYDFMLDAAAYLGLPKERLVPIEVHHLYTADTVTFFAPASGVLFRPEAVAQTRQTYSAAQNPPGGGRRLYLAGKTKALHGKQRRMTNATAVDDYFKQRGYECVDPGGLSLAQKQALFGQADLVLSPASSGNYNPLVFGPPAVRIGVICPPILFPHFTLSKTPRPPHILPFYDGFEEYNGYYLPPSSLFILNMLLFRPEGLGFFKADQPPVYAGDFACHVDLDRLDRFVALMETAEGASEHAV